MCSVPPLLSLSGVRFFPFRLKEAACTGADTSTDISTVFISCSSCAFSGYMWSSIFLQHSSLTFSTKRSSAVPAFTSADGPLYACSSLSLQLTSQLLSVPTLQVTLQTLPGLRALPFKNKFFRFSRQFTLTAFTSYSSADTSTDVVFQVHTFALAQIYFRTVGSIHFQHILTAHSVFLDMYNLSSTSTTTSTYYFPVLQWSSLVLARVKYLES